MSVPHQHIAIAGNIGAGKTTLTGLLAAHFGWQPHYEDVAHNPYLDDFYNDMSRWSFNLQVYFLNHRLAQLMQIRKEAQTVVQDRTIYEDACIFAPNLQRMGLMTDRDFGNYFSLFETVRQLIQPPDLLIYLKASIPKLVDQIQKRGREYEENIRLDYLKRLNLAYDAWIETYTEGPLLIIDVDTLDFAGNSGNLTEVISRVEGQLKGIS